VILALPRSPEDGLGRYLSPILVHNEAVDMKPDYAFP
jgi:hypothetical protein